MQSRARAQDSIPQRAAAFARLSGEALEDLRHRGTALEILGALAVTDKKILAEAFRKDTAAAVAFWINMYNAGALQQWRRYAEYAAQGDKRFYKAAAMRVGFEQLSLQDVSELILSGRRPPVWPGRKRRIVKYYGLPHADLRRYVAISNGYAPSPAMRIYGRAHLEQHLNLHCADYLESHVRVKDNGETLLLPRLFYTYRRQFGHRRLIIAFVSRFVPDRDYSLVKRLEYEEQDYRPGIDKFE